MSCGTGALTVAWDISVPADNYTTKISRGVGPHLHCNSTDMQCTAEGLVCGSSYVVNVFSITGTCISLPSADVTVQTCEKHRCVSILEGGRAHTKSQTGLYLSVLSAMSTNQCYRRTCMRTKPFSCDLGGQSECQILHCCSCECWGSQVRVHHERDLLQPVGTPVWRGLHYWCCIR